MNCFKSIFKFIITNPDFFGPSVCHSLWKIHFNVTLPKTNCSFYLPIGMSYRAQNDLMS